MNYKVVTENIRVNIKNYIQKAGLKSLVIGVSGGIDSAICCALAKPVCDELGIPLHGRSISIESNKEDEVQRATAIGNNFCTTFKHIDMSHISILIRNFFEVDEGMEDVNLTSDNVMKRNIRNGNVKARLRMISLYNLAQLHNGMVLSTDNRTELEVGFWTLHGDVGDYGMIQNLWKSEVYGLSEWLADNEMTNEGAKHALRLCIEATPTDGLGVSNSDLDQLGADSYDEVDTRLQTFLGGGATEISHPVIQRHLKSQYKRENPYNIPRNVILKNA
tara:strand:+ start:15851 stop:16678 length:828 start_codon:yes stop_codon:yes gene_type:complete